MVVHTLSAYLTIRGASDAIAFYMISDENPQCFSTPPEALGGSPIKLHLYMNNADATFSDAIKTGTKETIPLANQFWGDRVGTVVDPLGHCWMIATHIENVNPGEFQSRMQACFSTN